MALLKVPPESKAPCLQEHKLHKRSADSIDCEHPKNHKRQRAQLSQSQPVSVDNWVSDLPDLPQEFEKVNTMSNMSCLKRSRSASNVSELSSQSDSESCSAATRETKNSIYRNLRYPTLMESKGSFMRASRDGPLPEESDLYRTLLATPAPLPVDPLFEPQRVFQLRTLLQNRSELRVCIDLHPRLVPSPEILALHYTEQFEDLVEGYNDRWLDVLVFYQKLPQPDRTVAYKSAAFSREELRKLDAVSEGTSLFTIRQGMMFPFFTCEVKCGREALEIADRANTNSMTVALRAIVELYRLANNVKAVHRKTLGFSMSHDDGNVRIYGHYPKIDGNETSYFRKTIREYSYTDKDAEERWTSYTFLWNLYTTFAPDHLRRIKKAISCLPDPLSQTVDSQTTLDHQIVTECDTAPSMPVTSNADATFAKPGRVPRQTIAMLTQQLEQQRKDFMAQLEQQRRESKEREDKSNERHAELMKILSTR